MNIAADLLQVLRGIPRGPNIFLRREYDRLGSSYRFLARVYRRRFLTRTRIAAVIGSLGKTTTKRALDAALSCPDRRFSYSNYSSSLAGNLLCVRRADKHAALEVGIAGTGKMSAYAAMIRPNLVVVTAVKSEHNRSFPTLFDTRAEKVKMVRALARDGIAVLNGDDEHVRWMATQTEARVIRFGFRPDNDVRGSNLRVDDAGTRFDVTINGETHEVRSRLIGEHQAYPLLAAVAVAHVEGIDLPAALTRLAALPPAVSRMELITLPGGARVLDDSSKGNLESTHAALATVASLNATRKIVVLGNVEEPPGKQGDIYRDLGARLAGFADVLICIGGDNLGGVRTGATRAGMERSAIHLTGSRIGAANELLKSMIQPGDVVLLKGSSTQRLRRIVLALSAHNVSCQVKYCGVKVRSCDECPLLNAPASTFENRFVRRYVEA